MSDLVHPRETTAGVALDITRDPRSAYWMRDLLSVENLARVIHEAEYEDSFDSLNRNGIEYALRLRVALKVIHYFADCILSDGQKGQDEASPNNGMTP